MHKKNFLILFFALVFCFKIYANELSFDLTLNTASKYIWRGQKLYDKFCFQPTLNFYLGSFTINYFGVFPFKKGDYVESDYTFIASEKLPYFDFVNLSSGFTIYTFPENPSDLKNSLEIFSAISLTTFLNPFLKLYYDAVLGKGYYLETGINNSFSLNPISINLYMLLAYNANQWGYDSSFSVLVFTPELAFNFSNLTILTSTNLQVALNEQYQNDFIFNFALKYTY